MSDKRRASVIAGPYCREPGGDEVTENEWLQNSDPIIRTSAGSAWRTIVSRTNAAMAESITDLSRKWESSNGDWKVENSHNVLTKLRARVDRDKIENSHWYCRLNKWSSYLVTPPCASRWISLSVAYLLFEMGNTSDDLESWSHVVQYLR